MKVKTVNEMIWMSFVVQTRVQRHMCKRICLSKKDICINVLHFHMSLYPWCSPERNLTPNQNSCGVNTQKTKPKDRAEGLRGDERWGYASCFRWVGEASSLSHVGTVHQWLHYLVGCWKKNICLLVILPTSDVFIGYPPNLWWSHYDVGRLNQWNSNISPCHISI